MKDLISFSISYYAAASSLANVPITFDASSAPTSKPSILTQVSFRNQRLNSSSDYSRSAITHGRTRSRHGNCNPDPSRRRRRNSHSERARHIHRRYAHITRFHRPGHRNQHHLLRHLWSSTHFHSSWPDCCGRTSRCSHCGDDHLQQRTGCDCIRNPGVAGIVWLGD